MFEKSASSPDNRARTASRSDSQCDPGRGCAHGARSDLAIASGPRAASDPDHATLGTGEYLTSYWPTAFDAVHDVASADGSAEVAARRRRGVGGGAGRRRRHRRHRSAGEFGGCATRRAAVRRRAGEPDDVHPRSVGSHARGIFRVTTKQPMICAIVWGPTAAFGRFNNSLSMNGTGISQHDVVLPKVKGGVRYTYVVEGVTADGTLYRSKIGRFQLPSAKVETSPLTDGLRNVAPEGTVVATSSEFSSAFAGSNAIDDVTATEWSTKDDGDQGWITIDLGQPTHIAAVEFVTPIHGRRERDHPPIHGHGRRRNSTRTVPRRHGRQAAPDQAGHERADDALRHHRIDGRQRRRSGDTRFRRVVNGGRRRTIRRRSRGR